MKDFNLNKRKTYMDSSPFKSSIYVHFNLNNKQEERLFEHLNSMSTIHQIPINKLAKKMICHVIEEYLEKKENQPQ